MMIRFLLKQRMIKSLLLTIKTFCIEFSGRESLAEGLHETGNGFEFESPKSATSHRVSTHSPKHVEVIARYLLKTNRTGAEGEESVFISQRGGRLVSSNFRKEVRKSKLQFGNYLPPLQDAHLYLQLEIHLRH
jgi:hypothetical protein